ncbi:M56 family metallopeptidase [Sinomonas soli]
MTGVLVAAVLAASAAALVLAGPALLAAGSWHVRRPRLALALWHALFAAGVAAAVLGLAWCVAMAVAADDGARLPWIVSAAALAAAWAGLAALGALVAAVGERASQLAASEKASRDEAEALLAACASRRSRVGGAAVTFVHAEAPLVFSLPGRSPSIVVSTLVERELDPAQLRAVVEHECAHLAQRHDVVRRVARLNSACVPAVLGGGRFERAANLLMELAADDAAARVCGSGPLAAALGTLSAIGGSESMRLRADRLARRSAAHRPAAHRH